MKNSIIISVLSWPARHPRTALLAAAVLALLALAGALRIRPDASLVEMMASDSRAAAALAVLTERFPGQDELMIVASLPPAESDRILLQSFAHRFEEAAASASALAPLVRSIRIGRRDAEEEKFYREVLSPNALYYLSELEFGRLVSRLTEEGIRAQVRRSERMVGAPAAVGAAAIEAVARDPLYLSEILDERRLPRWLEVADSPGEELTYSMDGRSILIRLRGTEPPGTLEFTRRFIEQVELLIAATNLDRLVIEFSGAYAIAREAEHSIRRDMITSDVGAITLILALFFIVYRRVVTLALTIVPVLLGILIGFGAFSLISTSLTPLTAVIGAVIAGLGVDYAIHYIAHAGRTNRHGAEARAGETSRELFGPLALAAGASIAAFAAALTSEVPAVQHFGTIGAFGLAGALLMTLLVIPAGLSLAGARTQSTERAHRPDWSARMIDIIRGHHRGLIVASATFAAAAVVVIAVSPRPTLPIGTDPHDLHPQPNRPLELLDEIATRFGAAGESWPVIIEADAPELILERAHDVGRAMTASVEKSELAISGLTTLFPDVDQTAAREREIRTLDVARVMHDFDSALAESIFNPEAFAEFRSTLLDLLSPDAPPQLDSLRSFPALRERLLAEEDGQNGVQQTWTVLLIERPEPFVNAGERAAFVDELREQVSSVPGATLTGLSVVGMETERSILRGLQRVAVAAGVVIVAMLIVGLRSPVEVVLVLLPAAGGLLVTLAFVHVSGATINLVNLLGVPLLIGLGIDEGIFFVSAVRQAKIGEVEAPAASLQAVLLTTATDVIAFGSVAVTSTPAIRSLGILTGLGIIACLLATLFFLLPMLFLREARHARPAP